MPEGGAGRLTDALVARLEAAGGRVVCGERVDRVIDIAQKDAEATTRRLARETGLFVGVSSGGAAWAALSLAAEIERGVIVFIACDRGDRYLSSDIFR